ncbi:hypothetical protein Tco_0366851 [Tanacetum coccineum]
MRIPVPDGDGDEIEFFPPSGVGPGMKMDIEIGDGDGKHDPRNSLTHCHPYVRKERKEERGVQARCRANPLGFAMAFDYGIESINLT